MISNKAKLSLILNISAVSKSEINIRLIRNNEITKYQIRKCFKLYRNFLVTQTTKMIKISTFRTILPGNTFDFLILLNTRMHILYILIYDAFKGIYFSRLPVIKKNIKNFTYFTWIVFFLFLASY